MYMVSYSNSKSALPINSGVLMMGGIPFDIYLQVGTKHTKHQKRPPSKNLLRTPPGSKNPV